MGEAVNVALCHDGRRRVFAIKRGDTSPGLEVQFRIGVDGPPVNLNFATVRFLMRPAKGGAAVVSAPAIVADATNGIVRYLWAPGDTATPGQFLGEFEVTYADRTVETFPNSGYLRLRIMADIG
jgi:hypothetical protein